MLHDSVHWSISVNSPKQCRKEKVKIYLAVVFFEDQSSVILCDQKLSVADFETDGASGVTCERFSVNL